MIIQGRAVVIPGDDINTDVLYPGPYLNVDEPEQMKAYLFEGLDPSLRDRLGGDTVLVVGHNFGGGSSREHVPLAMKAWGVRAVVGRGFARIFYRNGINLGLPVVACGEAVDAATDDAPFVIDAVGGTVSVSGVVFRSSPMPPFLIDIIRRGGLIPWVRSRLESS
jgi:3-isopropylmalate/(R)-2-methylmalate dehydratase small subunit